MNNHSNSFGLVDFSGRRPNMNNTDNNSNNNNNNNINNNNNDNNQNLNNDISNYGSVASIPLILMIPTSTGLLEKFIMAPQTSVPTTSTNSVVNKNIQNSRIKNQTGNTGSTSTHNIVHVSPEVVSTPSICWKHDDSSLVNVTHDNTLVDYHTPNEHTKVIHKRTLELINTTNPKTKQRTLQHPSVIYNQKMPNSFASSSSSPSSIPDSLFDGINPIPINRNTSLKRKIPSSTLFTTSSDKLTESTTTTATSQLMPSAQPKQLEITSLLHQSCYLYPTTAAVVSSALRIDPQATRRRMTTVCTKDLSAKRKRTETYTLPLHIALRHSASLEVIKELIQADPQVIAMTDGPESCNALSTALYSDVAFSVLELILSTDQECLRIKDRHQNTSLHIAVSQCKPLLFIKKLVQLYPEALKLRNFHGQTPLDIAETGTSVSFDVLDYLQEITYVSLEQTNVDMMDDLDG